MSVLLELSSGTFVADLFTEECPKACLNFLKLCKLKYYNNNLIFSVEKDFIIQTGDPTGTGSGGRSVFGVLASDSGKSKKDRGFFEDEIKPGLELNKKGLLCMANTGPNTNASQFFVTLRGHDLEYLNGKHTIFGEVVEGMETLEELGDIFVDESKRPYQDVRVLHTHILDDPFPDPEGMTAPDQSPEVMVPEEETVSKRTPYGEDSSKKNEGRTKEEIEESIRREEAKSRAEVLEMMGDLPDADIKPPENVLFVCKLNPVTMDEDLEMIFSRFGEIKECEIIRDKETGDSLQYAFIEFTTEEQCQEAYFKMNNVMIDDRRIKVDFSQSVAKIWNKWTMSKRLPRRPANAVSHGYDKHSNNDQRNSKVEDKSTLKSRDDHYDRRSRDDDRYGRSSSWIRENRNNHTHREPHRRRDEDYRYRKRDRDKYRDRKRDSRDKRDRSRERDRRRDQDRRRERKRDRY